MVKSVGIHGVGTYLPPEVRRNDWWPDSVVQQWRARSARNFIAHGSQPEDPATEGVRRTLAAMAELSDDPFQGAVERRIMPEGMTTADMETAAAREALARAEVSADEIDLVLCYSQCPEVLNNSNACTVHRNLGLPERCFCMMVEGACNSFSMSLEIARNTIAAGRARYALLLQSANFWRLVDPSQGPSAWFGEGATAAVVGPVSEGKGVLASAHRSDGSFTRTLVITVPNRHWYDEGHVLMYSEDPRLGRKMILSLADWSKQVVGEALAEAGIQPADVGFYASHQATKWLREVSQEHIGLTHARSVDTFPWAGSLGACNVPLQLAVAEREGLLRDGDAVAVFTGGSGVTWSGTVMRWGT